MTDTLEPARAPELRRRLANLRDVASTNPALRPGVLYRSDAPHSEDESPADSLIWPPTTVIDLRDPAEKSESHPLATTSRLLNLPLLSEASLSIEDMPPSLGELYERMLHGPAARTLVRAIDAIATSEGPVLVHCTAGKDRTGVTIAVALALAGADREAIIADYALTRDAMPHVFARTAITVGGGLPVAASNEASQAHRHLIGAPREAIAQFLSALDSQPGGAIGWFQTAGGSLQAIQNLSGRLVRTFSEIRSGANNGLGSGKGRAE